MLCKCYLITGSNVVDKTSSKCIDCSDMISNLSDISVSYSRQDLEGVIRKCGSKFEFIDEARTAIIQEYHDNYLESKGSVLVQIINNSWEFIDYWSCPLDFSTLEWDSYTATISCLDNTAAAVIKSKKSTEYEFLVSNLKDSKNLNMDGVINKNSAVYEMTGTSVDGKTYTTTTVPQGVVVKWYPPFYKTSDDIIYNKTLVIQDQQESFLGGFAEENTKSSIYFASAENDCTVNIDLTKLCIWAYAYQSYQLGFYFELNRIRNGVITNIVHNDGEYKDQKYYCTINQSITLKSGDKLQFAVASSKATLGKMVINMNNGAGSITWNDRTYAVYVDAITPIAMLNAILDKMSEDENVYLSGDIKSTVGENENSRLSGSILVASESLRNINGAKAYSSFSKFCDFMECEYGYIYDIEENDFVRPVRDDQVNVYKYNGNISSPASGNTDTETEYSGEDLVVYCIENTLFLCLAGGKYYTRWKANSIYASSDNYNTYTTKVIDASSNTVTRSVNDTVDSNYTEEDQSGVVTLVTVTAKKGGIFQDITTGKNYVISNAGAFTEYTYVVKSNKYFVSNLTFSGIITETVTDSGTLSDNILDVGDTNVYFSVRSGRFIIKYNNLYYTSYSLLDKYNRTVSGSYIPRLDVVYTDVTDKSIYVGNHDGLLKYPENSISVSDYEKQATIKFRHKSDLFTSAIGNVLDDVSNVNYKITSSRMFSSIKIGYEKQDYDSDNNGKDEFNFSNTYTTGTTMSDSVKTMICPYRADCYGIMQILTKRYNDDSTTDSDQDMFVVMTAGNSLTSYNLDREIVVEGVYSSSVFNAKLAPIYMIEANKAFLGVSCDKLMFASSDGNSGIVIDGKAVNTNINIEERAITIGEINLNTDDMELPSDWNGLLQFNWDGYTYLAYIDSITLDYNKEFTYKLIEKSRTHV